MIARSVWYAGAAVTAAAVSLIAAAARPGSAEQARPDGAELFTVKGCATCHTGPGNASMFDAGPSLVDAASWAGERVEGLSAEEYIEQSIRTPSAVISPAYHVVTGGPRGMPLLQVSDEEIDALVDYLLRSAVLDSTG